MTEPADDGLERLKAFNELLRSAQPTLESGGADLDRLGHALGDAEGRLSLDLDGLASDVGEVHKEAQASAAAAVEACQDLNDGAEGAHAGAVSEVEKGAAAMQERWAHDLADRATTVGSGFQSLHAAGWEPLIAALTKEADAFDHWTEGADQAISAVVHQLTSAGTDVEHEITGVGAATQDLTGMPLFDQASWNETRDGAEKVLHDELPTFRHGELDLAKALAAANEQRVAAVTEAANHARAQLDLVAQQAADALDAEAQQLVQSFADAVEAVGRVQLELERAAVQGESTQAAAHRLADLALQVVDGDATLREVHALMEEMKEP